MLGPLCQLLTENLAISTFVCSAHVTEFCHKILRQKRRGR